MITCNAGAAFPLSSLSLAASRLRLWFVSTRSVLVRHLIERPHLLRAIATTLSHPFHRRRGTCAARLAAAYVAVSFLFDLYLSDQELP
jgi:hypothetical protein